MIEEYRKADETIKEIRQEIITSDFCISGKKVTKYLDALAVANIAFELLTPRKTEFRKYSWGKEEICPRCGGALLHSQGNFCSFCGQRLEMSEEV